MRRKEVLFLFMVLLLVSSILPLHNSYAASWYNSNWLYRQKITILPTLADADLTNFPYLVKITNAANPLFANAQADHDDILFTKSDGVTKLDHEIEYYESASGSEELDAWVQVESLSSTANTQIYMYYGNALVGNQENVSGVWSNDYEAVYHLHDDFNDSLAAHNGSNSGSSDVVGQIADAQDFDPGDGSNDEIHLGTWSVSGSALTIEAWIKSDDGFVTDDPRVISKAQSSGAVEDHVYMMSLNDGTLHENRLRFRLKTGTSDTSGTTTFFGTSPNGYLPDANQWYHVAMTYDSSQMRIIRDGHDAGSTPKTGILRENTWPVSIGNIPSGTYGAWDGKIDEVRISKKARELEWIAASYRNQNSPDTYQTLSPEEQAYIITGTVFEDADFTGTAADYDGGTNDLGLGNVDVELYDSSDVYIDSTTTDANGSYSFTGVSDGTYKIRVLSSTIGDADTPPKGGLNATAPLIWPYPLPEITWGNGSALYGGQSPTVDDTATAATAGPGDTYVSVTVSGADVSNVNLGFAYNLIVNVDDDINGDNVHSKQGSLRQFIKNSNVIGTAGGTTANSSQFRVPAALLDFNGVASIPPLIALPTVSDSTGGPTLDGTTQTSNIGNTNGSGPEVELDGTGAGAASSGLHITAGNSVVRGLVINRFSQSGIEVSGGTGTTIVGNYIGTNINGTAQAGNNQQGILVSDSTGNTIGGTSDADRNVISGNRLRGLLIYETAASGNQILGNYIGTNATGTASLTNQQIGLYIWNAPGNTIGGTAAGAANVISGNTWYGVYAWGPSASGNLIQGNTVGLDVTRTVAVPNGDGVTRAGVAISSAPGNTIGGTAAGAANVISGNTGCGVYIVGETADNNIISTNSIYNNGALGIDLALVGVTANDAGDGDTGPNNLQNFPVLISAVSYGGSIDITSSFNSTPNTLFRIEFFANSTADPSSYGEGETYLGFRNLTTDGSGNVSGTITLPIAVPVGYFISATATDPNGNTSEFSGNFTVTQPLPDVILLKSVATFSDPVNGTTNPKAIPGGVMLYTIIATNQGTGATDAGTVVLTDPISVNTALFVGDIDGPGPATGPVLFTDGTSPDDSGLNYTFTSLDSLTDDVAFSNDDGTTYTYVPVPDGNGFDTNVTHMRITPKGTFKAASGGDIPTFDVKFKVRVQ